MTKVSVDKNDFYKKVIEMVDGAKISVHFYSISCCWGFYSFGVRNFEQVLHAIRERAKFRVMEKYLDIRVLVKVDEDNPMDVFAADRLASVQASLGGLTGQRGITRNIFRELIELSTVQFIIVDGDRVLSSNIQHQQFNEELELVLNVSQPGTEFEKEDDQAEFARLAKTFETGWASGIALEEKTPRLSRLRVRYILQSYRGVVPAKTERELQLMLTGYLKGQIHQSIIDFEAMVVGTRIDLLVGPKPHHERTGIEIKFEPGDGDIDGIVGQLRNYRTTYGDLILVVGAAKYSPKGHSRLVSELKKIDVPLIELE